MRTKHIMVTGLVGWLGGLATALLGSSCDVDDCPEIPRASALIKIVDASETAYTPIVAEAVRYTIRESSHLDGEDVTAPGETLEARCFDSSCTSWLTGVHNPGVYDIEVEACGKTYNQRLEVMPSEDTCYMVQGVTTVAVDGRLCDGAAKDAADVDERDQPERCDTVHHPSVYVQVVVRDGAMMHPANVDRVWFEHEGNRMDALCIESKTHDGCVAWIAGQELTGEFTVFTEHCDTLVDARVTVERTPDGCHPDTQYLMLEADTRECITNGISDGDPPPPEPTPR